MGKRRIGLLLGLAAVGLLAGCYAEYPDDYGYAAAYPSVGISTYWGPGYYYGAPYARHYGHYGHGYYGHGYYGRGYYGRGYYGRPYAGGYGHHGGFHGGGYHGGGYHGGHH